MLAHLRVAAYAATGAPSERGTAALRHRLLHTIPHLVTSPTTTSPASPGAAAPPSPGALLLCWQPTKQQQQQQQQQGAGYQSNAAAYGRVFEDVSARLVWGEDTHPAMALQAWEAFMTRCATCAAAIGI